jgi:hypothetical protein
MASDPREQYGRIFHEQGRLTVNAEREKPFRVWPWWQRTAEEKEIDMRGASAVAAQAVADERRASERECKQLLMFTAHLPAIRAALTVAITDATYEAEAKPYRAALKALEGSEEGTDHG